MIDDPSIVQSEARQTAVIHLTIPRDQIQCVMGPAIQEVMETLAAQGRSPAGPVFSLHSDLQPDRFDFEVGVPVSEPVQATGRVYGSILPARRALRTTYTGPYEGLGEGWGEFMDWIYASGHPVANGLWECYLTGPESSPDPSTWRTELNKPLAD
ncbi:MAG: GyrI-like domain-containing protein [Verrucomicrobiota bacterium]